MLLDYLGFRERGHRGELHRRRPKNGLDMPVERLIGAFEQRAEFTKDENSESVATSHHKIDARPGGQKEALGVSHSTPTISACSSDLANHSKLNTQD